MSLKSGSFNLKLAPFGLEKKLILFNDKEKELKTLQEKPILQPGTLNINSAHTQLKIQNNSIFAGEKLPRLSSLPEEGSLVFAVNSSPFILTV